MEPDLAAAYGGFSALLWAIEQGGTTDVATLRAQLESQRLTTVYGEIAYNENRQNLAPLRLIQIQGEDVVPVAVGSAQPSSDVVAQLIFPVPLCDDGFTVKYETHTCVKVPLGATSWVLIGSAILIFVLVLAFLAYCAAASRAARARQLRWRSTGTRVYPPALSVPKGFHLVCDRQSSSGP